ncbi:hypothetical protein GHK92_12700 [Nocardioides sp. dk4132]|uniref:hypothetical protein n=1 Tax=unclassified Nocardioides TaxID=2615069 RepID=UPI001297C86B|nr:MULTISPECIES: hypothetical protein [unclassified Nocardioides]MQW76737.1 hypothetical protein [Nocardioides sp. dk4132]QGA06906.1 hypothetical protein GFH29_05520 [Nocardioides sp. dk884]
MDEIDALLDEIATHLTLRGRRDGLMKQPQAVSSPERDSGGRARIQWTTVLLIAVLVVGALISAFGR